MLTFALLAIQLVNMAVAPDSSKIKTATTAAIFFEQGTVISAPYTPDIERARKQTLGKLAKWKNLAIVSDPTKADVIIVVTEFNENLGSRTVASAAAYGNYANGSSTTSDFVCLSDQVRVFAGGKQPDLSSVPLWTKREACGYSWPLNRALDALKKVREKK